MKTSKDLLKALDKGKKNEAIDEQRIKAAKKKFADLVKKSASRTADRAIDHFCLLLIEDCNLEVLEVKFDMPWIHHDFELVNGSVRKISSNAQIYLDELEPQFISRGLSVKCEYIQFMAELKITMSMVDFLNSTKETV